MSNPEGESAMEWLQSVAHPSEDLLGAYVADCIDDEQVMKDLELHLGICVKCKRFVDDLHLKVN